MSEWSSVSSFAAPLATTFCIYDGRNKSVRRKARVHCLGDGAEWRINRACHVSCSGSNDYCSSSITILPQHVGEPDDWMRGSSLAAPQVLADDLGLGALFRLTHDAVIVVDLATDRVALLNRAGERMLGYTSQQAAQFPLERLVPFSERPGLHALVHGLVERPSAGRTEWRILGACAEERWVELTAHRIGGSECFALLVCHDVTERKLAEARRREQARVDGMLRMLETLGRTLDEELVLAQSDLQRFVADRHVSSSARVLAERGRQGVARALGLLNQLRRVGQVEDTELMLGPEDMLDHARLPGAANYDAVEAGKQLSGQLIHA
jgi:PAS domain S-box-containing protein